VLRQDERPHLVAVVLVGWCIARLLFSALLAAKVAALPDQIPGRLYA
jgi:hypothetical protein